MSVTKRILHIIPSLDRAGAERQLVLLAGGLPRGEFEVHVCALTRGGPLEQDLGRQEIPTHVIGKRRQFDPQAFLDLRRHVKKLRPDLVHTWLFAANSYGRAAALLCGVKCLVAGERCIDRWKQWHELAIDRLLARRTAAVVANSSGVRDFYVAHGLPAEKFEVIPNGVAALPPSSVTRAALLAELDLPPHARLIGAVGRLWPQKRWKDAIWAADVLKVVRDDAHLLIIGEGPQQAALQHYRDQIQLGDNVHFLGLRHDVPRLLPHFDLFWSSSGYEGLPNAVMEAMVAGVPVVATDISGNRDLVAHGQTGFLVPVGDRAAMARYANRLLNDRPLAERIGSAGRERILRDFTVDKMVASYAALYRRLLS